MKIAPNPAAFTSLSEADLKRVPREQAQEVKFSVDPESVKPSKKADAQRADQKADRAQQDERRAHARQLREAPRPRFQAAQRLGQHVDISV